MAQATTTEKIAIVRVRGNTGIRPEIVRTLTLLNLTNQHNCVIVTPTPAIMGMIKKVQSYVTYGVVDEETIKLLDEKRKVEGKKFYKLAPPRKGFERKGIKVPFNKGGALGNRKEAMPELIKRMV